MQLTESEQFKINLVNKLNKQRIHGINCDVEIACLFNNDRIYTHSIILNLFSTELMNYIEDKTIMTRAMCRINFPDEMSFVETNCFDCLKQVVNYLYEGEMNIRPNHEAHVQSIVCNMKMELLFSNLKLGLNENKNDLYSKNSLQCPGSPNINQHSNTSCKSPPVGINDNRASRHMIQSPLKKRLKFSRKYETVLSKPETKVMSMKGEEDMTNHMNDNNGGQIHSDGLHLLLSILEKENKREFLGNNLRQVDSISIPSLKNEPEILLSTSTKKTEPEEKLVPLNGLHSVQEERVRDENSVEKTSQDDTLCNNKSIMGEAMDSNKTDNQGNENTLLIETKSQVDQTTLLNETSTVSSGGQCKLKNVAKQKKTTLDKLKEHNVKRKTGLAKKKENEDKIIGVQDGFMCKKCKMFFDNISQLQEHMQGTHSKKLRCISCNFMTIKIRCFIDHLLQSRHEGTICSVCHYQTSTNEELHKHIIKHKANLPKPFFCNDCNRTFATRRIWSVHLPVHSNETQFLCAVCSKGFKWRQGLERHMTTHGKEKPYLCSQCAFNTVNQAYLAKHILSHNKKEVCPHEECKHREIRKENLKAHLLTHSKVKRFQCELCGKSFGHAKNLDRHLESMHNPHTTELTCNQCSYATVRLDKLKDHFKSRHKTYDYRQHVEQLKTSSTTIGLKVNRHLLSNRMPACSGVENQTSQVPSVQTTIRTLPSMTKSILTLPVSNQGGGLFTKSILTLPVTHQEGGLFRGNTLETKSNSFPIMITTAAQNKVYAKPKPTSSLSNNPLNRTIASRTNKTRRQSKQKARTKWQQQRRTENDSCQKSTKVLKTIMENKSENNTSRFRNIAPSTVLPSPPILLIISNMPRSQMITNVLQVNPVKPMGNQLISSNQIGGKLAPVNMATSNGKPNEYSTCSSHGDSVTDKGTGVNAKTGVLKCSTVPTTFLTTKTSGNYLPPTSSTGNHLPPTSSSGNYIPSTSSSGNYIPSTSSTGNYIPSTSSSGNSYFDVLDESTGELLLLTSKHMHNPLLDEATGELSVFEIPSSFINYIENITSSEYDNLLGSEFSGGNEPMSDFTQDDFSYRYDAAFILDELTGELNVTTKQ